MPEFIRPKRAIIEPGGDEGLLALLALLAAVAFAVLAAVAVAAWVVAHAVLLACCLMVFCVALGGFCVWSRWATSPRRLAAHQAAEWRERVEAAPPARDIPAVQVPMPERATWPLLKPGEAEALRQSFGHQVDIPRSSGRMQP